MNIKHIEFVQESYLPYKEFIIFVDRVCVVYVCVSAQRCSEDIPQSTRSIFRDFLRSVDICYVLRKF